MKMRHISLAAAINCDMMGWNRSVHERGSQWVITWI